MYTSLKFSKKLKEAGCELNTDYYYKEFIGELVCADYRGYEGHYPAYDILNDICVKYAKEFFGEKTTKCTTGINSGLCSCPCGIIPWEYHTHQIFRFIQQGKQDEAEKYIWEHCLFNPKNK